MSNARDLITRHEDRECLWCGEGFSPIETIGPHSTEHFCSSECAFASMAARALDRVTPGTYDAMKSEARRVLQSMADRRARETAERLRAGREAAKTRRAQEGGDA